jgi:putative ABC transport system ATP-binding protein
MEDTWKTYRIGKVQVEAIRGISLEINEGEFVAITGPSGSGKSTMMNLVGCLDNPTKGAIYLDNKNIVSLRESRLAEIRGKKIGFVFQQFNLIPTFTALENVMLPMEFQDFSSNKAKERAKKLLELLGLGDRIHHKPAELSGGEQQRVAIARALVNNPEVILADEPTGNLDSKTGQFIMNFLCELHESEKKTIVLVTHDINLVKYAKRIIQLKDGRIEKEIHTHKKTERR